AAFRKVLAHHLVQPHITRNFGSPDTASFRQEKGRREIGHLSMPYMKHQKFPITPNI
uniref:Uncharacterized protein n=1 Tax=Cucumis melo TaxID=3656 RepID=A0A9I9CFZ5_CUCME